MKSVWGSRNLLYKTVRDFFDGLNFLEVETPIIVPSPGTEIYLDYFSTYWLDHQGKSNPLFMRSSPELHLKKILATTKENRVFEIAKTFRNGGELSDWHHPEFTLLEWYQTQISFEDFMLQTEDLIRTVFTTFDSPFKLPNTFPRISVAEAFAKYADIDLVDEDPDLGTKGKQKGFHSLKVEDDFETAFFKIMLDVIEPELKKLKACFLYDYPSSMAALSKIENDHAKRFEVYIDGVEICNAFSELLDPNENLKRINDSNAKRTQIGKPKMPIDQGFIDALNQGMEPCCGNALGLDRLLAIAIGAASIGEVIPFRGNFK